MENVTTPDNAVSLSRLISENPAGVLGEKILKTYGQTMHLLLKFTQALGNSFQLHIPDGMNHPHWKPKPESWYYFEPGLMTCGVRSDANWKEYQIAMTELDVRIQKIAQQVQSGSLTYTSSQEQISSQITKYNPWQYVNLVRVDKGTLLDLSPCGIHHSWEEDLATIPLGNVLYEIQLNVMDDVATLRSFDKGKMSKDGKLRPLQIDDYFAFADKSIEVNDPKTHMRKAKIVEKTDQYRFERILETKYYSMDRITFDSNGSDFVSRIDTFRHLFVSGGSIDLTVGSDVLTVTKGHSAFIQAECTEYMVRSKLPDTEVLISY